MDPREEEDLGTPISRAGRWIRSQIECLTTPLQRVWSRERRKAFNKRMEEWSSYITTIANIGLYFTLQKIFIQGIVDIHVKSNFPKDRFDPSILLFFRSVPSLTMLMPLSIMTNQGLFPPSQTRTERCLMTFQTVAGGFRSIVIFSAVQNLDLGLSKMLLATKPLFGFVAAYLILGERIRWYMIPAMVLTAGGIGLALDPCNFLSQAGVNQTLVGEALTNQTEYFLHMDELPLSPGWDWYTVMLVVVTMAVCSSVESVIRKLKKTSTISMLASKDLVYLLMSGCWAMAWGMDFPSLNAQDIGNLLILAVLSIFISALNVLSLKHGSAGTMVLMDRCSGIIGAFLSDVLWYHTLINMGSWIGVFLVIGAISIIFAGQFFDARAKKIQRDNSQFLEALTAGRNESFSKVIDMSLNIVSLSDSSESLNPYTEEDEEEQEKEQEEE